MKYRKTLPWLAAIACLSTACGAAPSTSTSSRPVTTSGAGSSPSSEAQNKAVVLRLYSEAFNQGKTGVVNELVGTNYVQHDTSVPGGAAGQIKFFTDIKTKIPGAVATVKHSAADGDLVAVHWQASATPEKENTGEAVVDLYRVTGGKIVEHWDAVQQAPASTASGNSLFSDLYKYPDGAPVISEAQEESNKQFAVTAYRSLFSGDLSVLDKDWDPQYYYQHNPQAGNGVAELRKMLQGMPAGGGGGAPKFGNTLADGDLVWVFADGMPAVDIFRVANGKIVEHWDVIGGR
jgi:predicted SnoaL-like aldol condensation-catalyzing enzyme